MSVLRSAVVTGASSGIGAATARALAAEGFHVFCAARRADRITALAAEIEGTAVTCDVTDADSVAALAQAVGPTLHVLVNNAGGAFGADPVESADPEQWRAMYDVNVIGTLRVTQALLPALRASGDGLILNVGSTAGRIAYEGGGGYTQQRSTTDESHTFASARGAATYRRSFSEASHVQVGTEELPNLEESEDLRVNSAAEVVAPLSQSLALKVSYVIRYDNLPEPTFQKTDRIFTVGLQITF